MTRKTEKKIDKTLNIAGAVFLIVAFIIVWVNY